jgi:hypothetical protein
VEGGKLAGEGGIEGIGILLTAKGGDCNLSAGACDSMADQHKEEFPTVEIYEPPERRTGRAGQVWRSAERCPRHS